MLSIIVNLIWNYENNLIEMQNNIDFFDESIEIIEKIKREI